MLKGVVASIKNAFSASNANGASTVAPVGANAPSASSAGGSQWWPVERAIGPGECGVVLHLYYPDLWDEIAGYLANLPTGFGLHVSLCPETAGDAESRIRAIYPEADIATLENRGRDIGPFMHFLTAGALDRYQAVCKIHTKKSLHRADGDLWRRQIYESLLGSPSRTRYVIEAFRRRSDVGIVGPAEQYYSRSEFWGSNHQLIDDLMRRMLLRPENYKLRFFAGTMFWFRPAAFEPLRRLEYGSAEFPPEEGQVDGTTAHALERMYSQIPLSQGYRSLGISRNPPGLFDEEEYLRTHPDVIDKIESAEFHSGYDYLVREGLPAKRWPHCLLPSERGATLPGPEARLIAFYLPQFHPIPENDAWWGKGFTEWTNVVKAEPSFPGHDQPRRPTELGYYDLRSRETREDQAELARQHGIHAFCYYYYWFNGKRLLRQPLDDMLESRSPNMPFCLCWANENWTRRWDGMENEVLMPQAYQPGFATRFLRDVLPFLWDPRYLRYDGKPVLIIYKATDIPDLPQAIDVWREGCRKYGVGDIHLCAVRTNGAVDYRKLGFDAAVSFPPHVVSVKQLMAETDGLSPDFKGLIYDYQTVIDGDMERGERDLASFIHRGVMLGWDNTARRGLDAHLTHGCTPEKYGRWLQGAIEQSLRHRRDGADSPLVFVNAWNEWAEGTYLEPDERHGRAFLEATRTSLLNAANAAKKPDVVASR